MDTVEGPKVYDRLENFLDRIDTVERPMDLQEPFRSLWLRVHGEMPTLMSEDERSSLSALSIGPGEEGLEITSSDESASGIDKAKGGSIEFVSPKDVGPTLEMKVKDKKGVTFKMAGEEELKNVRAREKAASKILEIQKMAAPLKGMDGEASEVQDRVREIAVLYRDGNYDQMVDAADDLLEKLNSEDFKKDMIVHLQKKISEYESIGGDLTKAKERFKDLASSLKEEEDDFYQLASSCNALAEEAIKGLVEEEVVEVVTTDEEEEEEEEEGEEEIEIEMDEEEEEVAPETEMERERPEAKEEVGEKAPEEGEEAKPVVRIVTKKIVQVRKKDDVEEKDEPVVKVRRKIKPTVKDEEKSATGEQEKKKDAASSDNKKAETPVPAPEQSVPPEDVKGAFDKIQFVYKAAMKMHEGGKDMGQVFELMKIAEQAREKGDMKTYVGVANQLQNMIISMQ